MFDEPMRDRQAERRESTRQEILNAAWELAREKGLADLTLRDVANRIGLRPPSLYFYFPSKNAIYDAMFGQAWSEYLAVVKTMEAALPRSPRSALKLVARTFFDFAVADLARHQLMNQRTIPGFEPSPEAYAPAVEVLDRARATLRSAGVASQDDFDLCIAIVGGLVDAQLANDPGGQRWSRLLDRTVDMFADDLALPGRSRRRTT